jgi:pimeloyl-ACP methyl ester carboxylesterase
MMEWVYPYPLKMAALPNATSIAYADIGEGSQTLLFLHGLGSNLRAWEKNMDVLQDDFRCIALDFPGYGKSTKGNLPYGMKFFAQTIREFIKALNLKRLILVGHSMGAQIALTLAIDQPDFLEKLVLIAPAGFETFSPSEKEWFNALYSSSFLKQITKDQIVRNFEINFSRFPKDAGFMIDDRLKMLGTPEYEHFCNLLPQCVRSMLHEPVFEMLPKILAPTLVIFGENDQLIPNKILHPLQNTFTIANSGSARIPHAQLEMLRPCGHFAQWECAPAVNRSIKKFCL